MNKSKFCEQNFKIGTLNVCGLKRRLKYPEFVKLIRQYSILCVTETKIDESDIISAPNYTIHLLSKPRTKKFKRKYGRMGGL